MIKGITRVKRNTDKEARFSILIPSWNNLEYLKLAVRAIRSNSYFTHQIIVIINEGVDGSLGWIQSQEDIDYIHSKTNLGICYGLNVGRSLVRTEYILYLNDDMYVLPDWDLELFKEVEKIGHDNFMLSSTMIEPNGPLECGITGNYGDSISNFNESKLLEEYRQLDREDWQGSTWPPILVHVDLWDLVGGMSIEFSPGMFSDPDLSMKCWDAGVRYFKGVGKSKVYHFGSKSTHKIEKRAGRKEFLLKWGIRPSTFLKKYLRRGKKFDGPLDEPLISPLIRMFDKLMRVVGRV